MKLIRYYGKARNFNSIECVKKWENSDRNSYFFNFCSAAFTMIVFFTLGMAPKSILSQYYGKTAFFLSGTLSWNRSNTFQGKITTTKHGCFLYENWHEQSMWQKITMSSCNKIFKQVFSFLSNLTPASLKVLKVLKWNLYRFSHTVHETRPLWVSLRVNHLWFKLEKRPFCVLLYIIGGSRHLLIIHYKNLIGSYTTWQNCISNSNSSAIKVVEYWSKDKALEWHDHEAVSLFLNNFSMTFNCGIK